MSSDEPFPPTEPRPPRDSAVGYGRPPKVWQFAQGRSGNPRGRPKKVSGEETMAWLDAPIAVRQGDTVTRMHPKEVALRQQVRKGLEDDDLAAQLHLLEQFQRHGILAQSPGAASGGVLVLPSGAMPFPMALIMAQRFGPPSWNETELAVGRAAYRAGLNEEQARVDAAIGYPALEET